MNACEPSASVAVKFLIERFADVSIDAQPLVEMQWDECANYKDFIPLAPNYARYATLEAAGKLLVVTGRHQGEIVAYAMFVFDLAAHYSTTTWAENDIIWVAPEHRGRHVGTRLIKFAEKALLDRGVMIIHMRSKAHRPELGKLLALMGYEAVETVHAKILQRGE